VTAGLIAIAHGDRGQTGSGVLHAVFVVWVGLAIVVAAACALGADAALRAADLDVRELRPAVIGAAIAAQAMMALTVAVALYTVALVIDAPVAALSDGPLPTSATALLLYLVGPMVGFAIVAQITTARGWRALRAGETIGVSPGPSQP
jgi:ABC-type antimicrobial peptide transport system permease subunit